MAQWARRWGVRSAFAGDPAPARASPVREAGPMLRFASRRLLAVVPLAWGVATLVFLLAQIAPGEPFHEIEGPGVEPRAAEHLRALFGADRPLWERYVAWMSGSLSGDLGVSFSLRQPVSSLLAEGLRNTFCLAGLALALQFVLGTAAALAACRWPRGWVDRALVVSAGLLYSLPSFCLGIALVGVFSVRLGWLPTSQMRSIDAASLSSWARGLDTLRHLLLPSLTLALPTAGAVALYVRDRMRSVLSRPFVTAARARGAGPGRVLLAHALRNSLLPIVSLLGLSLPGLAGGAAVIEVLYAWPGMGRLAYQAVLARDEPLVLGCTLVASVTVILGSLAADLVSAAVDPRVKEATG